MNPEIQLKLQAYLDNELGDAEAREMASLLESDPDAQTLSAELQAVRTLLNGNELEAKLPESREFYWSKIDRAIQQTSDLREASAREVRARVPWWVKVFAPALGLAAVLVAVFSLGRFSNAPVKSSYLHEIETPLDDTGAISFHSQTAGMTVVWVQTQPY